MKKPKRLFTLLFSVFFIALGTSTSAQSEENLFDEICLNPGNVEYCYIAYTMHFCEWDPSQEKTSETLDCFVESGTALNADIVNCVKENSLLSGLHSPIYSGASGTAGWKVEYNLFTNSGGLIFNTGALWGGQEFDSTFVELFSYTNGPLSIDGVVVTPPSNRIRTDEALQHEFWNRFKEGNRLTTSRGDEFELSPLRDFLTTTWSAMESCMVQAPNIFE